MLIFPILAFVNLPTLISTYQLSFPLKLNLNLDFCDLKNEKDRFDLFAIPISLDVNTVPHEMQMETIELQSSNMLKAKYDSVPMANFYKEYIQRSTNPNLYLNAKRVKVQAQRTRVA